MALVVAVHGASWYERDFPKQAGTAIASAAQTNPSLKIYSNESFSDWLIFDHPELAGRVAYDVRLELLSAKQLNALAQRLLLIRLPEESSVVETRAQYPLVAMPDNAGGITIRVQYREKVRSQLSLRVFHREILLMIPHDGHQHFLRQLEELWIKASQDR